MLLLCLVFAAPPSVLDELTSTGLDIPGGARQKLPAPTLPLDADKDRQKTVLKAAADEFPPGLFLRKSLNAPYLLKVASVGGDAKDKRRGHTVDLVFVAYGTLKQLEAENILDDLLGLKGGKAKPVILDDAALKKRGVTRSIAKGTEERFGVLDATLIDKVRLKGVLRTQTRRDGKTVIATAILDERFADDKEHPNRWRSIETKPGGEPVEGPPEKYKGFGGYVKVTELDDPAGLLFVEMHFAFHEPNGWFGGFNQLASKLPIAIRDNVTKVRRKLGAK